jgi:hypothetical protein
MFLTTNHSVTEVQVTTKLIRQCLFKKHLFLNDKGISTSFNLIKVIVHPKEREIAFLKLHDALLCNDKLFAMKLIDSPECGVCFKKQTIQHIFSECNNSIEASNAIDLLTPSFDHSPKLKTNILSLVARLQYLNRNKTIKASVFIAAINSRILDFEIITKHKEKEKELMVINKLTLAG